MRPRPRPLQRERAPCRRAVQPARLACPRFATNRPPFAPGLPPALRRASAKWSAVGTPAVDVDRGTPPRWRRRRAGHWHRKASSAVDHASFEAPSPASSVHSSPGRPRLRCASIGAVGYGCAIIPDRCSVQHRASTRITALGRSRTDIRSWLSPTAASCMALQHAPKNSCCVLVLLIVIPGPFAALARTEPGIGLVAGWDRFQVPRCARPRN